MPRPLVVNDEIRIPAAEIKLSFARSAGPGGQNVNKVSSKAVLRWNVQQTPSLPAPVQARFLERYAHRINQAGEIVLTSDRHRDQPRNIADCYEKLRQLILVTLPAPRVRRPTRATRSSVERRLKNKRQISQRKQQRGQSWDRED
ncbi:MAG: aminoacyl-tRNA hydrolase [Pirellulales bacterium]|nr:aminoacyl-tRNA hydrolase [Pirellulales bacterium]